MKKESKFKLWILRTLRKAYHAPGVVLGITIATFIGTLIQTWIGMVILLLVLTGFAFNDMNKNEELGG